jgi:nitrogenase-stabilizing/protective protein
MDTLNELQHLSTAEDFFRYLDVEYDPDELHIARLHVMRRFGQYLERESLEGLNDEDIRRRCRTLLETARDDFARRSTLAGGDFSVSRNAKALSTSGWVPASALNRQARLQGTTRGGTTR